MWRYIFLALVAEAFIIYASVLVKVIEMPPLLVAFYRVTLALPFFALAAGSKLLATPPRDIAIMVGSGVLFGLDLVFFNLALHRTSIANVNLFGSLVCFVLVPIGIVFFGERIKQGFIAGGCVALVGVAVLLKGGGDVSVATPLGDFFALISMVCYSVFLALVMGLRKRYATMHLFFYASLGSSLTLLILASCFEGFALPSDFHTWGILLAIVLFGQILGQGGFGYIMGMLSAQVSSLLLLFSPIIAAVMGFVFLGEHLSWVEALGIVVILLGVYVAQMGKPSDEKICQETLERSEENKWRTGRDSNPR